MQRPAMYYDDRLDAARQLADALRQYRGAHPLVLAIPRGAVPMGRVIADALEGELDVVLARKLGAPGSDELAIGSIAESGWSYVADYARDMGVDDAYIERRKREQLALIRDRRALYTPGRKPIDCANRTCIVVDDGLATGATMIAALHGVRAQKPAKLICAAPVASRDAVTRIGPLADEIVCLDMPVGFAAVGQFYRDFAPVSDAEVVRLLAPRPVARELQ